MKAKIIAVIPAIILTAFSSECFLKAQPYKDCSLTSEERAKDLLGRLTLEEKTSFMMNQSAPVERLGIRGYNWWNEALHGVARNGSATVFPMPIAMAASFDDSLLYEVFSAVSDEGRIKHRMARDHGFPQIYQGLTFWTPNINLFRDPRWGRGMETYGEDPYLTGRMGCAVVRGLQGDPDAPILKAHACAKHLAVHSGPERLRHSFDAEVGERDLRESYLPAFKELVTKAGVREVMTAYNRFRGVPCSGNDYLVNKILRDEWGFKGIVVSDCGAISDFYLPGAHGYSKDKASAAAAAVKNGVALECGEVYEAIPEAVARGLLSVEDIDRCVLPLLAARFALGEMDGISPWDGLPDSLVEGASHRALSREMAGETMVLLKNDGILPLQKNARVALIGPNADDAEMLWGNYNPVPDATITPLAGLREAFPDLVYAKGCEIVGGEADRDILKKLGGVDIVIFAGGISPRLEGEELPVKVDGFDGGDRTSLELPAVQRELISRIHKAGKRVILVNFSGSAVSMEPEKETCNAILQAWYPGQEGGKVIADILTGKVNPSGKMPLTTYKSVDDIPSFEDYAMIGKTYRFFTKETCFPFGYGLSYTSFSYNKPKLKKNALTITVKNTGSVEGAEVVQLYVRKTGDRNGPVKTLRDFKRVVIPSGKSKVVSFTLTPDTFQWWNEEKRDMTPVAGEYEIFVGGSSDDKDLQAVKYSFSL